MSLLVVAYPSIDKKEFQWIQSIRKEHDVRYYKVIEPHFTIVFPVEEISVDMFTSHVQKILDKIGTFFFVLRCAQIVKDSFSNFYDLFLIPEEGYRLFVKLHDALYTGPLEKELRLDIPFIPHLGIANSIDPQKCKTLADKINSKNLEIVGAINKLDLVSFENDKVRTLKSFVLQ
jgi:2'-5' RNA ligase